jgi:hypothetical protein
MNEQAIIGALGFLFAAVGVVAVAASVGGLLAAGIASCAVGVLLGLVSTL